MYKIPPKPLGNAVPLLGPESTTTELPSMLPSVSVSFAITFIRIGVSSDVRTVSLTALGGSFTGVTVIGTYTVSHSTGIPSSQTMIQAVS